MGRARLVESGRPLSESVLWRLQRQFFTDRGVAAWTSGAVPHVLSTGPAVAQAYAAMLEAYAEDCAAGRLGPVEPEGRLYVVELGAGSGRLGFHVLRALERASLPLEVVYVLTDLAEANVAFWRSHPALAPYLERGALDVAQFDASSDTEVHLQQSGVVLRPSAEPNPIAVVANYLLDVIPQDLFSSVGGIPVEQLVAVACDSDATPEDAGFLDHAWVSATDRAVPPDRFGGGPLDDLLWRVASERDGERFLFPAAALRCLDRLTRLGAGRMLLLCGERPGCLPASLAEAGPDEAVRPQALLGLAVHGDSFSLPVDLDILTSGLGAEAGVGGGGGPPVDPGPGVTALFPDATATAMRLGAVIVGDGDAAATRRCARMVLGDDGPESTYLVMQGAIDGAGELTLPQVLAVIRLGGYDPYLLSKLGERLGAVLPDATRDILLDETVRVLEAMVDADFPLEGESDMAAAVGQLLHQSGLHEAAIGMFLRSRARRGPDPRVLYLEARCLLALDRPAEAAAALEESVALDPDASPAAELLREVGDGVPVAEGTGSGGERRTAAG